MRVSSIITLWLSEAPILDSMRHYVVVYCILSLQRAAEDGGGSPRPQCLLASCSQRECVSPVSDPPCVNR